MDENLDIDTLFENASKEVLNLSKKPNNEELLKLYGLYKQGLLGNNKTDKPSFFDMKANAKWNAWNNEAGKGKIKSKREYILYVIDLKFKYS